jgi:DNA-binding XRE family transcriptional regulator
MDFTAFIPHNLSKPQLFINRTQVYSKNFSLITFVFVKAKYSKGFLITVGKRIKYLREQEKISQTQLAFECGISQVQISRIERGEINTTLGTIYVIAEALNISVKDFF